MGSLDLIWSAFGLLLVSLSTVEVTGCIFQPDITSSVTCDAEAHADCKEIGFNTTAFPNVFGHAEFSAASEFYENVKTILDLNCSRYAPEFLCASVFPLCAPQHFRKVEPCREFCVAVRETCVSEHRQLEWPETLDCDRFPEYGSVICILENENGDCPEGSPPGFVIPTGIPPTPPPLTTTNCTHHLVPLDANSNADFGDISHCAESCDGVYFNDYHQNFMLAWIAAWSLLTLLVSVLIFLTYILNFKHISSLEAPIYYMSLCFAVVGLAYTISIAVGKSSLICNGEFTNEFNESAVIVESHKFPLCLAIFSLLYYFTLCTWLWWGALSIQWLVCTFKEKLLSTKLKVLLHFVAWGVPLVFLSVALGLDLVGGDPILNTCWIQKRYEIPFLLVPLFLPLVVCSAVMVVCFVQVVRVRRRPKDKRRSGNSRNDTRALVTVGTFCAAFMLPAGLLLCVYFYEYWYRIEWEKDFLKCAISPSECSSSLKPLFPIFLLKLTASLAMGVFSALWVVRKSSLMAWKNACCLWQVHNPPLKTESSERFNPNVATPTSTEKYFNSNSATPTTTTEPYFDPHTPTPCEHYFEPMPTPALSEQYFGPIGIETPIPSGQYFNTSATSSTIGHYYEDNTTPSTLEPYYDPNSTATTTDQFYDSTTTPTSVENHHDSSGGGNHHHHARRFTFSETSV